MTTPTVHTNATDPEASPTVAHRVRRTLLMTLLSYPYVLVTLPLLCGLIAHFLWGRDQPAREQTMREWFAGAGCITAVSVFAFLAVGYLVLVVISGWRQNERQQGGRRDASTKRA